MRCKHQQHGIGRVLVLDAPHHGRQVNAQVRSVQQELLPVLAIVGHDGAATAHTDEELMTFAVGMLTAGFHAGHVEHHEVALDRKRHGPLELADRQAATNVGGPVHAVQEYARDLRAVRANFQGRTLNALCSDLVPVGIDIANDLGRVAHDDGVGGHRAGHHCPRRNHGIAANPDAWKDHGPCADGRALLHYCFQKLFRPLPAAREAVVGKRGVGTNEHVVADAQAIPQLHPALDRDAVTNHYVVLDQAVRADIAVTADPGAGQDDDKLPDAGAGTDGLRLYV